MARSATTSALTRSVTAYALGGRIDCSEMVRDRDKGPAGVPTPEAPVVATVRLEVEVIDVEYRKCPCELLAPLSRPIAFGRVEPDEGVGRTKLVRDNRRLGHRTVVG